MELRTSSLSYFCSFIAHGTHQGEVGGMESPGRVGYHLVDAINCNKRRCFKRLKITAGRFPLQACYCDPKLERDFDLIL